MLNKIKKTVDQYDMFSKADSVLVGLSGGPDSVCLLHILRKFGLKLFIAHLNHGLRGKESDEDERFCVELGKKLGIPVYTRKVKVAKSEDAGRKARYEFLEEVARKVGARKIALGHNADDQVETVLMRLLRGAGARGLGGIPPVRRLGDLVIARPLINVWREEILEFLKRNKISYRIDSTNRKLDFFRNRVRHELMPFLARYNPNIKNILSNTGRNMAMVSDYFDGVVGKDLQGNKIKIERLKKLHPVIRQELVRRVVESLGVNLSAEQTQNILALPKKMSLPKGVKVFKEYDKLVFCKEEKCKRGFDMNLPVPGRVEIPDCNILIISELCKKPKKIRKNLFEIYLDCDRIICPLIIRNRRSGDIFQPIGLKGRKKVKDIFIDLKIPERFRDSVPIFVSGKDICWIPGYRIGEKFKVSPETKRVVKIKVKKRNHTITHD